MDSFPHSTPPVNTHEFNNRETYGSQNGKVRFLSQTDRAVCHARGLNDATIAAAGFYTGDASEVRRVLGFNPNGTSGLVMPNFDPLTGAIRHCRVRCHNPPVFDGKPAKYLSPKGARNILYFPPDPDLTLKLRDIDTDVYWTEAVFKALAAWQRGLCAVSFDGCWGWRTKGNEKQSIPLPDLDVVTVRERSHYIVFDSDVARNTHVAHARQAFGKELYQRRAGCVYGVNLPSDGGAIVGWDDYLTTHSIDDFLDLPIIELPPTDIPPFTEPISTLLNSETELIEWGIQGLQPVGASGWRIAGPKTGKSWDMLEECYCLATAQPVYGHFVVPRKFKVLMIEEEDPKRRIQRRLKRLVHAHGGIQPSDEFFRYSVKKGVRLDDPKWQEVIEWEIRSFRPDFVYLDVFNRLHSKNINDAEEMSKIILFLDDMNREYGCAFIPLHHTRKNSAGGDDHDEIIGSRVLGGFAEATLFFSRTKEKGVLRVKAALKDEPEDGSFEPEFLIKLTDTDDQQGTRFDYLGAPAEKKVSQELREKIKVYVLNLSEFQTAAEIGKGVGCSKPTARDHLTALYDIKVIARRKKGSAYIFGPINNEPDRQEKEA